MSLKLRARLALLPLGLAGLGLAAAHPAQAQTTLIPITNSSFESGSFTTITGFSGTPGARFGVATTPIGGKGLPVADKTGKSGLVTTGSIFQNTGATFKIGDTYTLTGYLYGVTPSLNQGVVSIDSFGPGSATTGTVLASTTSIKSPKNSFTMFNVSFVDNFPGVNPLDTIGISLGAKTAQDPVYYDDIKLTDTPSAAPEPSQVAGLAFAAFGALGLILKARKRQAGTSAA